MIIEETITFTGNAKVNPTFHTEELGTTVAIRVLAVLWNFGIQHGQMGDAIMAHVSMNSLGTTLISFDMDSLVTLQRSMLGSASN